MTITTPKAITTVVIVVFGVVKVINLVIVVCPLRSLMRLR